MSVAIPVSSTFRAYVEQSTFANGRPCVAIRMVYVDAQGEQQRGHLRFDKRTIPALVDALEQVKRSMPVEERTRRQPRRAIDREW